MTESAYSSIHGAEISERSTELVLPSSPAASTHGDLDEAGAATADFSSYSSYIERGPERGSEKESETGSWRAAPPAHSAEFTQASETGDPVASQPGFALPGDRGPRNAHRDSLRDSLREQEGGSHRPSFWRRIALGRRSQALRTTQLDDAADPHQPGESVHAFGASGTGLAGHEMEIAPTRGNDRALAPRDTNEMIAARASAAAERRIVEPLLQALVSVEAKLERSHVDLVGRSDQVEQRLTQLWDIEEQLGALGELQESVLQVTEQQRRLEAALVAQTRILRWLVGGIILSLAVAAFSVAFFLRVSS